MSNDDILRPGFGRLLVVVFIAQVLVCLSITLCAERCLDLIALELILCTRDCEVLISSGRTRRVLEDVMPDMRVRRVGAVC